MITVHKSIWSYHTRKKIHRQKQYVEIETTNIKKALLMLYLFSGEDRDRKFKIELNIEVSGLEIYYTKVGILIIIRQNIKINY
jgi:hypothetical protein